MSSRRRKQEPTPAFRDLLRGAGLTLSTLEHRAGLGRNDAWRYAAGIRSPRLTTVARMSEAIGADIGLVARSLMDSRERCAQRARVEEAVQEAILAAR